MGETERRLRELETLKTIAETLNRSVELSRALGETLPLAVSLLGLRSAWIFLYDPATDRLQLAADAGLPVALARDGRRRLCAGDCNCHYFFRTGGLEEPVNIVQCSRLQSAPEEEREGLEYHASVPLRVEGRALGILNVAAPGRHLFSKEDLALLLAVGYQLGAAVERARLVERQRRQERELAAWQERNRLARELHDSVTQLLFSLQLTLEAAATLAATDASRVGGKLARARELAGLALAEMRALIRELRPEAASRDLAEALRAHARMLGRLHDLPVEVRWEWPPSRPLPPHVETSLLRIAQEALSNVIRHARASRARVRVAPHREGLLLEVRDDGAGLRPAPGGASGAGGYGLRFMRERAEEMGGRLEVVSPRGGGTRVRVYVPLAPRVREG
ncbi:MAG: histidine kinase [Bacillota bacterium]|nr:MAG: histidine kinase [Bacillota bacterium]